MRGKLLREIRGMLDAHPVDESVAQVDAPCWLTEGEVVDQILAGRLLTIGRTTLEDVCELLEESQ